MPKRTDIDTILLIGLGPIVIGQACGIDLFRDTSLQKTLKGFGL